MVNTVKLLGSWHPYDQMWEFKGGTRSDKFLGYQALALHNPASVSVAVSSMRWGSRSCPLFLDQDSAQNLGPMKMDMGTHTWWAMMQDIVTCTALVQDFRHFGISLIYQDMLSLTNPVSSGSSPSFTVLKRVSPCSCQGPSGCKGWKVNHP